MTPEPADKLAIEDIEPGLRGVVRLLDALEALVLYELLTKVPRFRTPALAYWYVSGWIGVLLAILATSGNWTTHGRLLLLLFVGIAGYRLLLDVLRWWLDLLLDPRHYALVSGERNLFFAGLNLVEAALVCAIWLRAAGQARTVGAAAYDGFLLVTQLASPTAATDWAKVGVALVESTALVILVGGLAVVIAAVEKNIHATGVWTAEG